MNNDGSDLRQITQSGANFVSEDPYWSPDGRQVVFQSNHTGNFQIYVMAVPDGTDADGSNPVRLTNHRGNDYWPCWGGTSSTNTMTAERLVDECARAMGGIDKIDAFETMRFTQKFPDHGALVRYEIKRPNRVRMGDDLVFDGQRASWLEGKSPDGTLLVPQEEWQDFEVDIAWYIPAFFDYPAEYMGTETLDDIETHKLQVALPLGAVMTYYLDAQTYLVYRAAARFTIGGQEYHPERTYSDYRLHDGIRYPYACTYEGRTGVFTATMGTIEFNVPLGDERFAVPTAGD